MIVSVLHIQLQPVFAHVVEEAVGNDPVSEGGHVGHRRGVGVGEEAYEGGGERGRESGGDGDDDIGLGVVGAPGGAGEARVEESGGDGEIAPGKEAAEEW